MKRNKLQKMPVLLLACCITARLFAQDGSSILHKTIASEKMLISLGIKNRAGIRDFYEKPGRDFIWLNDVYSKARAAFVYNMQHANEFGLNNEDYNIIIPENTTKTGTDSVKAELLFCDAAFSFYSEMIYGNKKPVFGYNGLQYIPAYDAAALFAESIATGTWQQPEYIYAAVPEIKVILERIKGIIGSLKEIDFTEKTISSDKVSTENIALVQKLGMLGLLPDGVPISDSTLLAGVKKSQAMFGLLQDGKIRSGLLSELNVPLSQRLKQLVTALNYYRWLFGMKQLSPVIVVNIPAAYLKVYEQQKVILQMRMVVGKRSTPTPVLTSVVDEVILYPYWHVPRSITIKEMLPKIKRNPGYLDEGGYQLINMSGKITDPHSLNLKRISASNFPYIIRQSTGCDNALGLLKLNFYSPYGVYLHDTPNKNAFLLNQRFLSHGCMRMEKPMEMGRLILQSNSIAIDTLEQKGCVTNQSPVTVKALNKLPVIVWYNPAGTDSSGNLMFYPDIYGRLKSQ